MYHGSIPERQVLREERMDPSIVNQQNKRKKIEGSNANIPSFPVASRLADLWSTVQESLQKPCVITDRHHLRNDHQGSAIPVEIRLEGKR